MACRKTVRGDDEVRIPLCAKDTRSKQLGALLRPTPGDLTPHRSLDELAPATRKRSSDNHSEPSTLAKARCLLSQNQAPHGARLPAPALASHGPEHCTPHQSQDTTVKLSSLQGAADIHTLRNRHLTNWSLNRPAIATEVWPSNALVPAPKHMARYLIGYEPASMSPFLVGCV